MAERERDSDPWTKSRPGQQLCVPEFALFSNIIHSQIVCRTHTHIHHRLARTHAITHTHFRVLVPSCERCEKTAGTQDAARRYGNRILECQGKGSTERQRERIDPESTRRKSGAQRYLHGHFGLPNLLVPIVFFPSLSLSLSLRLSLSPSHFRLHLCFIHKS